MGNKKQRKNKKPSEKWKKYSMIDKKVTRKKTCPKCGPAVFMADHKNRFYCGTCHYSEMK